jgi:hypothetical protein
MPTQYGHTIAQAVNCWFLTMQAQVHGHVEFVATKMAT